LIARNDFLDFTLRLRAGERHKGQRAEVFGA
jgi:hypothetical protein